MVIDTSAVIAILQDEPERAHFAELLSTVPGVSISAANYVEAAIIMETRKGRSGLRLLKSLLLLSKVKIVPVDTNQAEIALDAYSRFGKGRHKAALNYGDCFAYALARHLDEPLLFKGKAFSETDIKAGMN